ncbi:MAG: RNHCP domain-containing protein [Lachnospiraceae bacterium]|uniref:RNHCP domain-containing protein n=1 Tax=Candidatus Weimeria bifida TaxID=2599074 RepID=A0A6N7J2G4_9FIRM|nr:RNHCP domain-containing protein [Candidatus Weimeria bifida]RRF97381.1 MAG: RNHCP domain-containing protein [Lachnospiraceae bacterium]
MNRENKRRKYDKNYYKKNPCTDSFTCRNCGWPIVSAGAGSNHRNHCPNCLCSLHVDNEPGDRASDCGGIMEPIGVWVRGDGEWAIIHRCRRCGKLSSNRIAADDNPMKLMALAMKPVVSDFLDRGRLKEMLSSMQSQGDLI